MMLLRTFQVERKGFTFFQMLIAIAIIAVLLAIALPAIHQVRAESRRVTCMNNIRFQALGILSYEIAHQHLPPAAGLLNSGLPSTTDQYSGFLSFFLFTGRYPRRVYVAELEHNGMTFPAYPDVNNSDYPLWSQSPHGLICPSVADDSLATGLTHYSFSIGDVARNVHTPQAVRGAFAVGRTQNLNDIIDGLSTTIGLAEIGGRQQRSAGRHFAIRQSAELLDNPSLTGRLLNRRNQYHANIELASHLRGGNWADGTGGPGLVNTILPPGGPSLLVGSDSLSDGFFSASVNHSGGTVVAFVDGTSKFVSKEIDTGNQQRPTNSAIEIQKATSHYGVWGAFGSANGSESLDADF